MFNTLESSLLKYEKANVTNYKCCVYKHETTVATGNTYLTSIS